MSGVIFLPFSLPPSVSFLSLYVSLSVCLSVCLSLLLSNLTDPFLLFLSVPGLYSTEWITNWVGLACMRHNFGQLFIEIPRQWSQKHSKTKLNQDSFYLLSITRHNYLQVFSFFLIHPCSSYHSALPVPQDSWGGIYFTSLKGVLEKNILVKGEPFPCILPTKVIRSLNPLSIEGHFPTQFNQNQANILLPSSHWL